MDEVNPNGLWRLTANRALIRFGTVRRRVQIPGPRPFLYSKMDGFMGCLKPADHSRVRDSWGTIATEGAWVVNVSADLNSLGTINGPAQASSLSA